MDQRGDHMKINFEYFQTQKWILQTVRSQKVHEKNGVICLVSILPSWVMVLKLSKKCIFCNFMLTSARNLSLLKQFTYIHLKRLVTHLQEMILFIRLWLPVSEILVFEVEEFCYISAESASFLIKHQKIANISWALDQTITFSERV